MSHNYNYKGESYFKTPEETYVGLLKNIFGMTSCMHTYYTFQYSISELIWKKIRYYITLDMTPYIVKICFYTISYDTLHYYIRYFKSDKPLTMLCNDKWKDMIAYNTPDMTSYTIIYNNT